MGILKISEHLHDQLRHSSQAFDRSLNGQAEHWIKVGMLAEMHQDLSYKEIIKMLLTNQSIQITPKVKNDRAKIKK